MDFVDGFKTTARGEEEDDAFEELKDKLLAKLRRLQVLWLKLIVVMNKLEI